VKLPAWLTPWRKATDQNTVTPIRDLLRQPSKGGFIVEAFGGAWQANLVVESQENLMRVSAVYASIALRARDIAKLRVMLMRRADNGIWDEVTDASPFLAVLRKPNRFQTRIQFFNYWMVSKLMQGNTYVLKDRDERRVVRALYPLDPYGCLPLVAPDGEVYYKLHASRLAGLREDVIVPASEIIHDRCITPWHPLVGVSPLYASGPTATAAIRMQSYSEGFFKNMSRPSGQLTAPGTISEEVATRVKREFESGFAGGNIGRIFVSGDDLKFQPFTMPAEQSQLIEQLKWSVEDVARAFGVPLYKIQAGDIPSTDNVGALNQQYLDQTLMEDIVSIEALLDEGLELPNGLKTNVDEDGLMRMDPLGRAKVYEAHGKTGLMAPDEARRKEGRHPVPGGKYPYMQQQNYSLEALAKRDAKEDPFGKEQPATAATPAAGADEAEVAAKLAPVLTNFRSLSRAWRPQAIEMKRAA
jgi:HK97 family phage portal protein